jgi:4-amino-4-deoxy-L-arabinose transferase-like glycosyltransferase
MVAIFLLSGYSPSHGLCFPFDNDSNDPMLTFLSAGAFYFLISYAKSEKPKDIFLSVIFSALAALTKISSGFIFFIIIGFLIYKYGKNKKAQILNIIFAVFLIGFICLGAGLWRAYIPSTNQFRFVESYSWSTKSISGNIFLSF